MGACMSKTDDNTDGKAGSTHITKLPSTSQHRASTSSRKGSIKINKRKRSHSPTTSSSGGGLRSEILSPNKYLPTPGKWFPSHNAHANISKLFEKKELIGKGCTGKIYSILYRDNIYAVKQIDRTDKDGRMLFTTEARCLSKLKHDSIIKYIDMLMDKNYYYLILEKADYDLYRIMNNKGYISEKKTKKIMYGLFNAIYYIHKKNLVHRDLKPENIVFKDEDTDTPILIDFGDAEMCRKDKTYIEFVGTPPYMSPERLGEHNADQLKKADVWALGVIAYEMFSGERCFKGNSQKQVFRAILNGTWSWKQKRLPSEAMMDFVSKCLDLDHEKRISAKEAVEHPWFDDIKESMNTMDNMNKAEMESSAQSNESKKNPVPQQITTTQTVTVMDTNANGQIDAEIHYGGVDGVTDDLKENIDVPTDTEIIMIASDDENNNNEKRKYSPISTKEPVSNSHNGHEFDVNENNESTARSDKYLSPSMKEKTPSTEFVGDEYTDNSPIDDHDIVQNESFASLEANVQSMGAINHYSDDDNNDNDTEVNP